MSPRGFQKATTGYLVGGNCHKCYTTVTKKGKEFLVTTFYVLCGNAGSGKSTFAGKLMDILGEKGELISSDLLRKELSPTGDESDQSVNTEVFAEVYRRIKCPQKPYVIIDVSNCKGDERRNVLGSCQGTKVLIFFDASIDLCIARQHGRVRKVPIPAIHRMDKYLKEDPPCKNDGADIFLYYWNFFLSQV